MSHDSSVRKLLVLFGDQLDTRYLSDAGLERERDAVALFEVADESHHVRSHFQRTVLFLSAMRHSAAALREDKWRVHYVHLNDEGNAGTLEVEIPRAISVLNPEELVFVHPGEMRIREMVERVAGDASIPCVSMPDSHFLTDLAQFNDWASGRREMRMEHFYREQRRRLGILVDDSGAPEGDRWNYDKENRKRFSAAPNAPEPPSFMPDETTQTVIHTVRSLLPDLPGYQNDFRWAVTREQWLGVLDDFVLQRLPVFGEYEDAMWEGESTLFHSVLSAGLNLKLLRPCEIVDAALSAYEDGHAPLNSVEGFVRQVIGWREFIRGVYWHEGADYGDRNNLDQHGSLPWFYWDGDTDMQCMSDVLHSVLTRGYAHHIPRLMVTGNFALIAGVRPQEVADWYLGMYVDGVDWATRPNVLGMTMFADGGVVASKPYAASGKYINRMSNYCSRCVYDVRSRTSERACPFNVFYWDFLLRNGHRFAASPRMALMVRTAQRIDGNERKAIDSASDRLRERFGI